MIAPYRVMFPIGLTYALLGAGVWPLYVMGALGYPGIMHRLLMIQGFEQSFVMGFFLTAMPGLTKGEPCRPAELAAAAILSLGFGVAALCGALRVSEALFAASVALLILSAARRVLSAAHAPPAELLFVGFGFVLGIAGALITVVLGNLTVLAGRMISLGMVLSLVLGLGGLLVPTFTGMREGLAILGVAGANDRARRIGLYVTVLAALAGAFVAEALAHDRLGAGLRAMAATVMILLVWKAVRFPGRRDPPAFVLWTSGWLVLAGLWSAAIAPRFAIAGYHVVFIGGFGLLTLGIATRVVVGHGRHPLADERLILSPVLLLAIAVALVARLAAETWPVHANLFLAMAGGAWFLGWGIWGLRGLPRIVHQATPVQVLTIQQR